jgi:hypothetical protein
VQILTNNHKLLYGAVIGDRTREPPTYQAGALPTELSRRLELINSSKFNLFLLHFVSVSAVGKPFLYRLPKCLAKTKQYIATLAQLVERHFCKVDVVGSNPTGGSIYMRG